LQEDSDQVYLKICMHEQQEDCQYISDLQQKDSEYESDLEQQQGCKYDLHLESDSSIFADFSMDRDACIMLMISFQNILSMSN
jgi:hypothetical protein